MHMLCRTGTVCFRVEYPHFIFDRIYVRTLQKHMCRLLRAYLTPALKQVLSLCPTTIITPLLFGGEMYSKYTFGSTIDPSKQWVLVINIIVSESKIVLLLLHSARRIMNLSYVLSIISSSS